MELVLRGTSVVSLLGDRLIVGGRALCDIQNHSIVHASKRCHKQAVGYPGTRAPHGKEYLTAIRGSNLYLNLIDPPDPAYIAGGCIQAAVTFIAESLESGEKVAVHCDKGESRAPAIALLYLISIGAFESQMDPLIRIFKPSEGIKGWLQEHVSEYLPIP